MRERLNVHKKAETSETFVRIRHAILLSSIAALWMHETSQAAPYSATGQIAFIRAHDIIVGQNIDWFAVTGATSMGQCLLSEGLVVLRIKDDQRGQRQFALITAAKTAGTPITVVVDDANVDPWGYCYVRYIHY